MLGKYVFKAAELSEATSESEAGDVLETGDNPVTESKLPGVDEARD